MWAFFKNNMKFDSLITADTRTAQGVIETMSAIQKSEAEGWAIKSGKQGSLFIFVYWFGHWERPNGSVVFTEDGGAVNLDHLTVKLASLPRVYVCQWVEMGKEIDLEHDTPETLTQPADYKKGIKRWFAMFYNSNTDKFIEYLRMLMSRKKTIVLPDEFMVGGFSTVFGAGIKPDKIVLEFNNEDAGQNFKTSFDIWDSKP